jgi:hypothetical protein
MVSEQSGRRHTARGIFRAGVVALTPMLTPILMVTLLLGGCVRRTITVTTEPPGALCWLNGAEVGRTPVTVDFLHYGEYDVQLVREGYEPLLTSGKANAPLWDIVPVDLAAELWPGESHADIRWHYVLAPREDDRPALLDRAQALREKLLAEAPAPASQPRAEPQTQPQAQPQTQPQTQPQSTPSGQ